MESLMFSEHVMSDSPFCTCLANASVTDAMDAWKHTLSISHPTKRRYFGSSMQALAVERVPVHGSTIGLPSFENLLTTCFIQASPFCQKCNDQLLSDTIFLWITTSPLVAHDLYCSWHSSTMGVLSVYPHALLNSDVPASFSIQHRNTRFEWPVLPSCFGEPFAVHVSGCRALVHGCTANQID